MIGKSWSWSWSLLSSHYLIRSKVCYALPFHVLPVSCTVFVLQCTIISTFHTILHIFFFFLIDSECLKKKLANYMTQVTLVCRYRDGTRWRYISLEVTNNTLTLIISLFVIFLSMFCTTYWTANATLSKIIQEIGTVYFTRLGPSVMHSYILIYQNTLGRIYPCM